MAEFVCVEWGAECLNGDGFKGRSNFALRFGEAANKAGVNFKSDSFDTHIVEIKEAYYESFFEKLIDM